jgi:uncharacterized protein
MDRLSTSQLTSLLSAYFENRKDIAFAFLFGSAAEGRLRPESDVDVAVYFQPGDGIEWEEFGKRYDEEENRIAIALEKLFGKEVDLIVLNRAKALLADEILRKGHPLVIKNRDLYLDFLCLITDEAEFMRDWILTQDPQAQCG